MNLYTIVRNKLVRKVLKSNDWLLDKELRAELIQHLVKRNLKAITENDVLLISGRDWLINERKLSQEEVLQLKEEASSFRKSLLWHLISNDVQFYASQQMVEKAVTTDDILFGKSMVYNLSMIRLFITRMKDL
jgi:hypothetical protein